MNLLVRIVTRNISIKRNSNVAFSHIIPMHCDEKRTISALKQYVTEATLELQELDKQLKSEQNNAKKIKIQSQINNLQKIIQDSNDQLSSMS